MSEDLHSLSGAYALDALDADERNYVVDVICRWVERESIPESVTR